MKVTIDTNEIAAFYRSLSYDHFEWSGNTNLAFALFMVRLLEFTCKWAALAEFSEMMVLDMTEALAKMDPTSIEAQGIADTLAFFSDEDDPSTIE